MSKPRIEVEKKFQPTREQLGSLLEGSEFLGIEKIHDIYYDHPDFRLLKGGQKLRNRNGNFELKIKTESSANLEIENKKEIEEYFKIYDLDKFIITNGLVVVADYETEREKYTKEGFSIHKDRTNFGYEVCEIERLFKGTGDKEKDDETVRLLKEEIVNFAIQYGWEVKKIFPKWAENLRLKNKEGFQELFGLNKENKTLEVKMK